MSSSPRALRRGLHPRALRLGRVRGLRRVRLRRPPFARDDRDAHRRAGGGAARRGAALCHRRQWRDLLRPRRDGAFPGLHHGHGDRQPRHADRQYRARRRGGEPAPRPEQRAGLLRHGLVPARAARLPPREERRCARDLREAWGVEIDPEPGLRIPNMLDAAVAAPSRGSTSRARTSCSPTPTPSTSPPVSRRWNASSSTTCS
jgi:hypothetical protein